MVLDAMKWRLWRWAALGLAVMVAFGALFVLEGQGTTAKMAVAVESPGRIVLSGQFITINVELTDAGFHPSSIAIPRGRRIQLLVRNLGRSEHHFHVLGLAPKDMLWLASGESEADGAESEETADHAAHHYHGRELVTFHTCTTGVCPTGNAVDAHADPGEIDVVWFTATEQGTFDVVDPTSPELRGSLTVY
ncbi:MAG: cupredoxin domain-containing protein [Chloroflexi bacterium]|nr:cupredoxin domain-containing protein [Chloroflexota bacterium]